MSRKEGSGRKVKDQTKIADRLRRNNNNSIHLYSADSILICSSAMYNSIKVGVCYACMYVCMYVCTYVYICVCMCIYAYVCVCMLVRYVYALKLI